MKNAATYVVSNSMIRDCDSNELSELEEHIKQKLASKLACVMTPNMTLERTQDLNNDTTIYSIVSGTNAYVTSSGNLTVSNGTYNHFTDVSDTKVSRMDEYRVAEICKNGKIVRVELQRYDGHRWCQVPRVKIEE